MPIFADLLGKLLNLEPEKRISAKEALEHVWFGLDGTLPFCHVMLSAGSGLLVTHWGSWCWTHQFLVVPRRKILCNLPNVAEIQSIVLSKAIKRGLVLIGNSQCFLPIQQQSRTDRQTNRQTDPCSLIDCCKDIYA